MFHMNNATALKKIGRYEEALSSLKRALEINPKNSETYNACGVLLVSMEKYSDSLDYFDKAIRADSNVA